jgi:putative ABC transport system permease protein
MTSLRDAVRQLLADMRGQKLRTFLTLFGIVWGTVAVTLLLAFGYGLKRQLIKSAAGLGDRIAIAWPGLTSIPYEGLGKGRRIRVTEEDVDAVRRTTPQIVAISAEYEETLKLHYGMKTIAVDVSGVSPEFGEMRNMVPAPGGRWLNPLDEAGQRRVLFVGNELAKDVFGEADAIGKVVLLGGSPFEIVGVLQKKSQDSSYSGRDSGKAFAPGTTIRALTGAKYVDNMVWRPVDVTASEATTDSVRHALARKLRFHPDDKEALGVWDTTNQFKFFETFMLAFSLFLGIVGSLTLVVGGIGVSNIMNVVVEERTKEIGIKMALGARARFILSQLLLETLLLTGLGGAIGFGLSWTICAAFPKSLEEYVGHPEISPFLALVTVAILGVIGLLSGWFPARAASRLDPVYAMKAT